MQISFFKYNGTGNDFILLDNRAGAFIPKQDFIGSLCNRRFGIGADGLIELKQSKIADFEMIYYNSDGNKSTMCGNGGRCIAAFAQKIGIVKHKGDFLASDGIHAFEILETKKNITDIALQMQNISNIDMVDKDYILDSGSPHFVRFLDNANETNVFKEGEIIRYSKPFSEKGINVNFVSEKENSIFVRTYERGVEAETLSCGTGVVASAAAYLLKLKKRNIKITVETLGGILKVEMENNNGVLQNIKLSGPATFVFQTKMEIL